MQRQTIRRLPCDVQVQRRYRLPHSAHFRTSVRAYLLYLPVAVMQFFFDLGSIAFLRLSSSCARLYVSRLTMAGWLFSTIYMGASPSFAFLVFEMQSMVTLFCRMQSPQYFSFRSTLNIMLLLNENSLPGILIFSSLSVVEISLIGIPNRNML